MKLLSLQGGLLRLAFLGCILASPAVSQPTPADFWGGVISGLSNAESTLGPTSVSVDGEAERVDFEELSPDSPFFGQAAEAAEAIDCLRKLWEGDSSKGSLNLAGALNQISAWSRPNGGCVGSRTGARQGGIRAMSAGADVRVIGQNSAGLTQILYCFTRSSFGFNCLKIAREMTLPGSGYWLPLTPLERESSGVPDDYDPSNGIIVHVEISRRLGVLSILFHESMHASLAEHCTLCTLVENPLFDPSATTTEDIPQFILICEPTSDCYIQWEELRTYDLQHRFLECLEALETDQVRECLGLGEEFEGETGLSSDFLDDLVEGEIDREKERARRQFNWFRMRIARTLSTGLDCPRGDGVFPGGLPAPK